MMHPRYDSHDLTPAQSGSFAQCSLRNSETLVEHALAAARRSRWLIAEQARERLATSWRRNGR